MRHFSEGTGPRTWRVVNIEGDLRAAFTCECNQVLRLHPDGSGNTLIRCSACNFKSAVILDGWDHTIRNFTESPQIKVDDPVTVAPLHATSLPLVDPTQGDDVHPVRRPDGPLMGRTYRMRSGEGTLYITVNRDARGKLFEVFIRGDKAGGCEMAKLEGLARLVSLSLRSGVAPGEIVAELQGIRCGNQMGIGPRAVLSCSDAIAQAIKRDMESL